MHASIWVWLGGTLVIAAIASWLSVRYIPHTRVGVIEKLWASQGSVTEGRIIAMQGEAGYQAEVLRGGIHFGYWRWQYRVHQARNPLAVTMNPPQGRRAEIRRAFSS